MSKKNDLFKIYIELDPFLSDSDSKEIKEKLLNVENNVEPKLEQHFKSKNKLATNLKTYFFNGRALVHDAIKKSDTPIEEYKNKPTESWMDRYDLDDINKQINLKKQKINIKKELAKDILNKTNDIDHEKISDVIDRTTDIDALNIINGLLIKSYLFNEDLNEKIIEKRIKKNIMINKFLSE